MPMTCGPDERTDEGEITRGPRRHEARRQRVEKALCRFVAHHNLPSDSVERLADEIYRLWRDHEMHKLLDGRDRRFHARFRRQARALAERTEQALDADILEHAKRMVRHDTLERRKVGRGKAIEGAIAASFSDLSSAEKRSVKASLRQKVLTGSKIRKPAPEIAFLTKVAAVLERKTGRKIAFSSYPHGVKPPTGQVGRHHGPEFDVMMAAALMADFRPTNEALATLIRRIRKTKLDLQKAR